MPLVVHFLNVGHGDCTIIEFSTGRLAMVDINNSCALPEKDKIALAENSGVDRGRFSSFSERSLLKVGTKSWEDYYTGLLVDPVDYLKKHFRGRELFRYIQTHPDMDHMSGLHRLVGQEGIVPLNFWDIDHTKKLSADSWQGSPYALCDWEMYESLRSGNRGSKVLRPASGDRGSFWVEDDMTILGPTPNLVKDCNERGESWNNASFVLRIDYAGRRVLLGADAEGMEWDALLAEHGPEALRCDVLKAAHHGRESGFAKPAAMAASPDVVVCSVGKKPSTDASDEYQGLGAVVLSTRYHGTMTATIHDDGAIIVTNHKGANIHGMSSLVVR
jgi:beta-lactamase superfamily II metal-dependent hydrolase